MNKKIKKNILWGIFNFLLIFGTIIILTGCEIIDEDYGPFLDTSWEADFGSESHSLYFSEKLWSGAIYDGVKTIYSGGSYTWSGNTATLNENGVISTATVSGNTLTLSDGRILFKVK